MLYVIQKASKLDIPTPCITFDQPLWVKAVEIVQSENLPIVVRLGSFHTLGSFVGSIGMSMEGSGLEEAFGEIYAGNVVPHMLSGKAYTRALRCHFLVHAALMYKIYQEVIEEIEPSDVQEVMNLIQHEPNEGIYREDIGNSQLIQMIIF